MSRSFLQNLLYFFILIVFDQRGCGLSEYKEAFKDNTIQKTAEDANRLLDYLQIKTKVVVAGCSWGSTCALFFSETYPERVKNHCKRYLFSS